MFKSKANQENWRILKYRKCQIKVQADKIFILKKCKINNFASLGILILKLTLLTSLIPIVFILAELGLWTVKYW